MSGTHIAELERKRSVIQSRMREMSEELRSIEGQIAQLKADEYFFGHKVKINKKNERKMQILALVRQYILDAHERYHGKGLTTKELYDRVLVSQRGLKYSSFRSYLHRFEQDEIVFKVGHGGAWRLTELRGESSAKAQ